MNFRLQEIILTIESIKGSDEKTVEMICQILIEKVSSLDQFLIGNDNQDFDVTPLSNKTDVSLILKELADIKAILTQPQQKHVSIKRGYVVIVKDEKTQVLLLGPEMRSYDLNIPESQINNNDFISKVVFDAVQNELIEMKTKDPEFAAKVEEAQVNIQIIPIPESANETQPVQTEPS